MENSRIADNVFFDDEKAINIALPKWPAFVVSGKKVTAEQAAEILIRTDYNLPDFTYAGNDSHHARRLNALFDFPDDVSLDNFNEHWEKRDDLLAQLKKIGLGYIGNAQIVSSYVNGPHGWCNWNGDVFCNSYNIGKWPSVEEVAREWGLVAEAFPYLDLRSQLFNGESSEDHSVPVVEFVVSEGVVVVTAPRGVVAPSITLPINPMILFGSTAREHGITVDELKDKLISIYGVEYPKYAM